MTVSTDKEKLSEALYRSVADGDHDPRLKESFSRVKEVCDEIEKHGGRIYVGRVGKLCQEKFKGPAAQSIRNKPDTLKRYVELRTAEQQIPMENASRTILDKMLQKITDPVIRSFVILQHETNLDLSEQIRRLSRSFGEIIPQEIDKLIAKASTDGEKPALSAADKLTNERRIPLPGISDRARRALEKITSEEQLRLSGLRLHKGHVLTGTNRKFLDKEEFAALKEMLRDSMNGG